MTIHTYQSFDEYHAACDKNPGLRGSSPGATAASLGLCRQAVYSACLRNTMDLCRIWENGQGPYLIVTQESVNRYRENSLGKVGRSPRRPRQRRSVRQSLEERATMATDKLVHHVWSDDS